MKQQRVEYYTNAIYWYLNRQYHRNIDLPTDYCFKDGKLCGIAYRQNGNTHRTTGPAYINYEKKIKLYCYHGKLYDSLEEMLMVEICK